MSVRPLLLLALLASCDATTGGDLVQFGGAAGGAPGVTAGVPFTTGSGWTVSLDRAHLHFGAVYLNESVPISGRGEQPCVQDGIYVGQIFGPLDLDLLSDALVPFPVLGQGTETPAHTAEVWLLEGDINRTDDAAEVLGLSGTASRAGATYPFHAAVTIGANRATPPPSLAMPGANPICEKRIVSPIPVDLTPTRGGALTLVVDVRGMLNGLDFSLATPDGAGFVIPDEAGGAGGQLFAGLHASVGVYTLSFR
jgi:hypothetical protein